MIGVPDWYGRNVSRETVEKLRAYASLIEKWTKSINLIAKSTVPDIMERHIWDSAQAYAGESGLWADFGSGGGLPAVVVAILAQGEGRDLQTILVESDQRKCTFLRTCARELVLPLTVKSQRIEALPPLNARIISARALADLETLLSLCKPHMATEGRLVFMKGARWQEEIRAALESWRFSYDAQPSNTEPNAAILRIEGIERI